MEPWDVFITLEAEVEKQGPDVPYWEKVPIEITWDGKGFIYVRQEGHNLVIRVPFDRMVRLIDALKSD